MTSAGLLVSSTVGSAGTTTIGLAGELDIGTVEQLTAAAAKVDDRCVAGQHVEIGDLSLPDELLGPAEDAFEVGIARWPAGGVRTRITDRQ